MRRMRMRNSRALNTRSALLDCRGAAFSAGNRNVTMTVSTRMCEALTESSQRCNQVATNERNGRPVCDLHAQAPVVNWQDAPKDAPPRKCPTCGGAGVVNFMGWGVDAHLSNETCPDCNGERFV